MAEQKNQGKKVRVMASGVFDILHLGHIHYLSEAKKLGDELVVVVASDSTVLRRKKHKPITPATQRVQIISALKSVDEAIIGREGKTYDALEDVRPDILALGYELFVAWVYDAEKSSPDRPNG